MGIIGVTHRYCILMSIVQIRQIRFQIVRNASVSLTILETAKHVLKRAFSIVRELRNAITLKSYPRSLIIAMPTLLRSHFASLQMRILVAASNKIKRQMTLLGYWEQLEPLLNLELPSKWTLKNIAKYFSKMALQTRPIEQFQPSFGKILSSTK